MICHDNINMKDGCKIKEMKYLKAELMSNFWGLQGSPVMTFVNPNKPGWHFWLSVTCRPQSWKSGVCQNTLKYKFIFKKKDSDITNGFKGPNVRCQLGASPASPLFSTRVSRAISNAFQNVINGYIYIIYLMRPPLPKNETNRKHGIGLPYQRRKRMILSDLECVLLASSLRIQRLGLIYLNLLGRGVSKPSFRMTSLIRE